MSTQIPVLCFVGRSKVGKTTLLENLISALKSKGYRVATIKHHHRAGFDIDKPGKDTWRYAQAGAEQVMIVAPDKLALVKQLVEEPSLAEVVAGIEGVDIILTEGYKQSPYPKIEVVRAARSKDLVCSLESLLAVVSDIMLGVDIACFSHDDMAGLVKMIENEVL